MQLRTTLHNLLPVRSFSKPARLFLIAVVVDGIIYSAWSLFFNFYILARGFDKDFLGLVNALPSLGALIFIIPLGMLSDRMGRRRAMLLGLVVNTIAMGLQVTFTTSAVLLSMVFIGGLGSNLYFLSQSPFVMSASDGKTRTLLFSLTYGLSTLSGAVGSLFAGQLPNLFGNILRVQADSATAYQAVLLCAVVLGSLSLLPIYLLKEPEGSRAAPRGERKPVGQVFRKPILWKVTLPQLLIGFGAAILIPYMNVFFSERFALSDERLGVLFSLSALLTGVATVIGPKVAHKMNSKIGTVVLTQGLSLVFLVLMGFTPFGWMAALGFLARGTFMNMAHPLYNTFVMEQFNSSEQGTANSVVNLAWTAGWAVGPYISGVVQMRYGFQPLFVATSILYATAIVLTFLFFYQMEKQQVTPAVAAVVGD
ncbi:MAG TPA: MFS transporter [Anaerolineaceae bacterium]